MKKLFIILALGLLIASCNPRDTWDNCQNAQANFGGGGFNDAECGVFAFGQMFVNPDWF